MFRPVSRNALILRRSGIRLREKFKVKSEKLKVKNKHHEKVGVADLVYAGEIAVNHEGKEP